MKRQRQAGMSLQRQHFSDDDDVIASAVKGIRGHCIVRASRSAGGYGLPNAPMCGANVRNNISRLLRNLLLNND